MAVADSAADVDHLWAESAVRASVLAAPQYLVHQTPRLQPGNAPLAGTPADDGKDRVDLLWQTMRAGEGLSDEFVVEFRPLGSAAWQAALMHVPFDTGFDTRRMHSASLRGLDWDSVYEYRVQHWRGGELEQTYAHTFRTRLRAGDLRAFTFVAYGDSSASGDVGANFRRVQSQINTLDPRFALLLGDNIYDFGTHREADARFVPALNPPATSWIAGHVDYLTVGNHDVILNVQQGQPTRDSYATPLPVAGMNAYAAPPADEYPEHNFSFDYGDVHFVSFDSNFVHVLDPIELRRRMLALLDYVVADLASSNARWKIVSTHHPTLGTEKASGDPSGPFFQEALPRLRAAGVDLLLVGDSHTYSWTYPLTGFQDTDRDGVIAETEVTFVHDSDRVYEQDAGLVQVVSGVGGRSLRTHDYGEPFVAAGFSRSPGAGPIEDGFTQIDVHPMQLVVRYISGETGRIVGDTNANGRADGDERHFGEFVIRSRSAAAADLDHNGAVDVGDIDYLCAAILENRFEPRLDFERDQRLDGRDHSAYVQTTFGTRAGDANLDGHMNSRDLVLVFQAGRYHTPGDSPVSWNAGDWNCDGQFDSRDLVIAFQTGDYEI
jgi:hypothetical protein